MNAKAIAKILDSAAEKAEMIGQSPASSKQCWFLACLIEKNNDETTYNQMVSNFNFVLTKREASNMISMY